LASYITGWSPQSWLMLSAFVLFTGIILGGSGNVWGVVFGIALIPIGFREVTRLLPEIGYPGLVEALSLAAIGLLALAVIWLRPRGVLPEKPTLFEYGGGRVHPWRTAQVAAGVSSASSSTVATGEDTDV